VSFDHNSIFLRDLRSSTEEPKGIYRPAFILSLYCVTSFPKEEDILSGKTAYPPARMTASP
jgi:hypothetical protein